MDLLDLRKRIDEIDSKLIPLFIERMGISKEVAEYKVKNGMPVLNEKREKEILDNVKERCGEQGDAIATVFAATMDASRELQHRKIGGGDELRQSVHSALTNKKISNSASVVACAGVSAGNTDQAAKILFPHSEIKYYSQFEDVFEAVNKGEAPFGVIPIENSTAGSVHEAYDLMMRYKFYVVGAYSLDINHCLCAANDAKYEEIEKIYSHPQALAQCSKFIKDFNFTGVNYSNTAAAAKYIAESGRKDVAAICPKEAAKQYGLKILKTDIQNVSNNKTRFIVISKKLIIEQNADKISLIFSVAHTTGSLYRVLGRFSMAGLNLTKLESRPIGNGDFDYYFYTDFLGNLKDEKTMDLLCALSSELPDFKFLGNYHEY